MTDKEQYQRETDCRTILLYLFHRRTITVHQIYQLCGTKRGSARIFDLRKAGHQIHTDYILSANGKRFANYVLQNINESDRKYTKLIVSLRKLST